MQDQSLVNSLWRHTTKYNKFYYRCSDVIESISRKTVLRLETHSNTYFYLELTALNSSPFYDRITDKEEIAMATLYLLAMND